MSDTSGYRLVFMSERDGQQAEVRLSPRLQTGLVAILVALACSVSLGMAAIGGYLNAHATLAARERAIVHLQQTAAAAKHQVLAYQKAGHAAKALVSTAPTITQALTQAAAKMSLPATALAQPQNAASLNQLLQNATTLVPVLQQAALLEANFLASRPDMMPVHGIITSGFAWRVNPITGHGMQFHHGYDIAVPIGTPVHAVGGGTVIYAQWAASGIYAGFGYMVVLNNGYGVWTTYGHNSKILVKVGQHVVRGQVIALSGNTGMSTGPHVDFRVEVNGVPVNPGPYLTTTPLQAFKAWLAGHESGLVAEWTKRVRIATATKTTTTLDHSTKAIQPVVQGAASIFP